MCYNTAQLAERIYRDAVRTGASPDELDYLRKNWEEKKKKKPTAKHYHVSGFEHPELVALQRKEGHLVADRFVWGLIPHWTQNETQAHEIWNKTLNARGETMFEKASFRNAAAQSRLIVPLDGFYEHYHKKGKTFPHFIRQKDGESLLVGALGSSWKNPVSGAVVQSMSIVTTKGNDLMRGIHNNPKLTEARMPLILSASDIETWMSGGESDVQELIRPSEAELEAHTVRKLKGKGSAGNDEAAQEVFEYAELYEPPTLF